MFTDDDPYAGVDLDDCRAPDTGELADWAHDIIDRLDSYTEASPSGTGVHVLVRGEPPTGKCRDGAVELYDRARYFTMTGQHLDLTPETINDRPEELAAVHAEYVAVDDSDTTEADGDTAQECPHDDAAESGPALGDDDVIAYAKNASNGDTFEQLWRGDTSGYKSHSEADQALCNILAFWTDGDPRQMERLFEQSGLVRDKWREREDYRERTIRKAICDCPSYYSS